MGKDLDINFKIQNYIKDLSKKLHPVQSEIISYNESLGDIKRMQIAISQCYFLELITKIKEIPSSFSHSDILKNELEEIKKYKEDTF